MILFIGILWNGRSIRKLMLSYFSNSTKNIILECDINVEIEGQSSLIITMMSNQVKLDTFDKHKYINEIY